MKFAAVLVTLLFAFRAAFAQEAAQGAIPSAIEFVPLFTIEWNLTANVVHYDAKLNHGRLDPKEPVVAYWIMNQTDGHRESLTFIERLKAYGFSIRPTSEPESYDLTIVSTKKNPVRIARMGDRIRAVTKMDGCEAYIDKVRVQAHKWHMLNIADYAEMIGSDIHTGAECHQRIPAGKD